MRWPKYWSFSFRIIPYKEIPGLISFRMDWLDLLAVQGTLKSLLQHHSSKASILQHSAFFTGPLHISISWIRNYSILSFQHLGSLGKPSCVLHLTPSPPNSPTLPNSPSSHAATAEMRLGPLHPGAKLHKDSVSWLMRGAALTTEWHCFIASDYLQSLTKLIPMPLFINTVFFFFTSVSY